MSNKPFKMPTVKQFLERKRMYSKKQDLEWIYLEDEMIKNADKKPYNKKVHDWLVFLKDLRRYKHDELVREKKILLKEIGPRWYCEFSTTQRAVIANLKANIHQDLLEDIPRRTRKALQDLGLGPLASKIPTKVLLSTLASSMEDPGLFMWNLYTAIYLAPPSKPRTKYDVTAMILMSSLVFIDLADCVDHLEKLTHYKKPPEIKIPPKKKKPVDPNLPVYLQTLEVAPLPEKKIKKPEPLPLGNKFRLRSEESYEDLRNNTDFLEKRIQRNIQELEPERICKYKFWEPPSTLRNTDPKMIAYVNKLKMLKIKPKVKFRAPFKNTQFQIGTVVYSGGKSNFLINSIGILPTGYIIINAGNVLVQETSVTCIGGYWLYPKKEVEKCQTKCECLTKWEASVMDHLKQSKCKCGHLYDLYNEGKLTEKYFYQPNKQGPYCIDKAKIYQMDPMEDFIKDVFRDALKSADTSPARSAPSISAAALKESQLVEAFLADLSDTYLVIPHLPQANELSNLKEWTRKRVKGLLTPKDERKMYLHSARRWINLKHTDHRARAYFIPFTEKQLKHFNWSQRTKLQILFDKLLDNFVTRNRKMLIDQTRVWWPTTKFDAYPGKPFLDIFFTYFPSRMQDVHFINPYSARFTPKYGAKTCPLNL